MDPGNTYRHPQALTVRGPLTGHMKAFWHRLVRIIEPRFDLAFGSQFADGFVEIVVGPRNRFAALFAEGGQAEPFGVGFPGRSRHRPGGFHKKRHVPGRIIVDEFKDLVEDRAPVLPLADTLFPVQDTLVGTIGFLPFLHPDQAAARHLHAVLREQNLAL